MHFLSDLHTFVKRGKCLSNSARRTKLADLVASVDLRFNSWLSGNLSFSQPIRTFDAEHRPDPATENRVFFQLTGRY